MSPRCTILAVLLVSASCVTDGSGDGTDAAGPALAEKTSNIVGGSDAPDGKWPDTVAVLGAKGSCSGTLIAPDVVLTAGHCADIEPLTVIANTTDYSTSGGTRVAVTHTEAYPNWQTTYDASVIVLAEPITTVKPRALGTSCTFSSFAANTMVRLVGFGATSTDGTAANTRLKEAMTMVTDPMCAGDEGCNPTVAPGGEFVAGGTGTADSCFGDSGGPVYLDTDRGSILVGAVSRGVDNADTPCGGGGIYVRTDKIVTWIEDTVGQDVTKDACPEGEAYAAETIEDDHETVEVGGCSASTNGIGIGACAFAVLSPIKRRRRVSVTR